MISKKNIAIFLVLQGCHFIFSQDSNSDDTQSIDIPDVSTAIGSEGSMVDVQAVPDFTLILPEPDEDFLLTLNLPADDIQNYTNEDGEPLTENENFAIDGIVGGGYPGYFLSDINVSQYNAISPFKIHFSHTSQNGLGTFLASEGYTQSNTLLLGETELFFNDQYSLTLNAQYETSNKGFQNKSPQFYLSANQFVHAHSLFEIHTHSGWNYGLSVTGEWQNRYLGKKTDIQTNVPSNIDAFGVGAQLFFSKDFSQLAVNAKTEYRYFMLNEKDSHRMDAELHSSVSFNEANKLNAAVGIVYEEDLHVPVLVPFSILFYTLTPKIDFSFAGGMRSEQIDYNKIYNNYPFTNTTEGIYETSQWYSEMHLTKPVSGSSLLHATISFEQTAFGHGYLLPDYEIEDHVTGLYDLTIEDVLLFNTNVGFSTNWGMVGFFAGWDASWIDVLPGENSHELYAIASISSKEGLWGTQLSLTEAFFEDAVPNIGVEGFFSLSSAVQFEIVLHDFVKLVTGSNRQYAGKYVVDSGYVGLFARFFL